MQAWYDARAGQTAIAIARAREAFEVDLGDLPLLDAGLAGLYTDLLLLTGADVESVVAAGQRGLEAAQAWDLDLYGVRVTRYNMAEALLRAGYVRRAAGLIEPHTQEDPTEDRWVLHVQRARLDMLQGRAEAAIALVDKLRTMTVVGLDERLEDAERFAAVELWTGRQQVTFDFLVPLIEEAAPTEVAQDLGPTLTLAARAAAGANQSAARLDRLTQLSDSCAVDPFTIRPVPADSRAWAATWSAELSRLRGRQALEPWGDGRWRVGQTDPAARRGLLPVAGGAGSPGSRPRHCRAAAAASRRPRCPRARPPLDSHRRSSTARAEGATSWLNVEIGTGQRWPKGWCSARQQEVGVYHADTDRPNSAFGCSRRWRTCCPQCPIEPMVESQ